MAEENSSVENASELYYLRCYFTTPAKLGIVEDKLLFDYWTSSWIKKY